MQPPENGEEDLGIDTTRLIKPIDALSAHRITSGQVVIDLQTAVKELVENSLDAGATNVEVRFREHGLESIEVVDNGSGISPPDYDAVAWNNGLAEKSLFAASGQIGKKKASGAASVSERSIEVKVCGWISKFAFNCGRTSTDRQFFYVNGRPCQLGKVQKAFNEVYRTFNATQVPFVIANFLVPSDSVDVNVSPDKRTIFLHGEDSFVQALKVALEDQFAPERSTYDVQDIRLAQEQKNHRNIPRNLTSSSSERQSQDSGLSQHPEDESQLNATRSTPPKQSRADDYSTLIPNATPLFFPDEDDDEEENEDGRERPPDKTIRLEDSDNSNFGTPHLLVSLAAPASIPSHASEEPALPLGQTDEGVASPSVVEPDVTPRCSKATSSSASNFRDRDSPTAVHEPEPGLVAPDQRAFNGSARVDSFARTPASKEIALLSSRAGPFDRQQAGTSKQAQLVLSTQGASWNLKRRRDVPVGDIERPSKRHVGGSSDNLKPLSSRPNIAEKLSFKSKLAGYARPGSQQQLMMGPTEMKKRIK
ncbi:hypothetical protein EW026_g5813 [Hermanssonia centrifuga]|uniref:DNA mismatch repair protein S5 domain-containing protein n=1 Tax=Hermanssonia centrifuga TaxID=98765 RepID=A0A4S4KD64_9APHY|nr:hypothetical protein EW026_g5813 [Hermanssonia centrifuga]